MRKAESCRTLLFSAEDGSPGAGKLQGAGAGRSPGGGAADADEVRISRPQDGLGCAPHGAEAFYFSGAFMV